MTRLNKLLMAALLIFIGIAGIQTVSAVSRTANKSVILCSNKVTGALRTINSGNCARTENKIVINKQGRRGPVGDTGAAGTNGATGNTGPTGPEGPAGPLAPRNSYSNTQLQRSAWFEAPSVAVDSVAVGSQPTQAAFDGEYLWVVNSGSDSLTRINVNDHSTTAFALTLPSGSFVSAIALMNTRFTLVYSYTDPFIPALIVSFTADGLVGQSMSSSGLTGVIDNPSSDGSLLWLPNSTNGITGFNEGFGSYGYDLSSIASGNVVSVSSAGSSLTYMVMDCTCAGGAVVLMNTASPILGTALIDLVPISINPTDSVITNDEHLWVISESDDAYIRVPIDVGADWSTTLSNSAGIVGPTAIATDGTDVYVVSQSTDSVTRIKPDGRKDSMPVGNAPVDIVYDGTYFWVINSGDNTVTKVAPF